MPIYDYRCDHCGHAFSAVQGFKDERLAACPSCGKRPRRLITTPSIVFKGSGWYKTDSRAASPAGKDHKKAEKGEGPSEGPAAAPEAKTPEKGSAAPKEAAS